jgi:hypothetical protein
MSLLGIIVAWSAVSVSTALTFGLLRARARPSPEIAHNKTPSTRSYS